MAATSTAVVVRVKETPPHDLQNSDSRARVGGNAHVVYHTRSITLVPIGG